TPEGIAAMTPEAALDLHARTHVPANAVLFIIGNSDLPTATRLVDEHLGNIPAGDPPPKRPPSPFEERREIIEVDVEGSSSEQVIYLKRVRLDTPIARDRLGRQLDLLYAILDSTLDGSLAKPLRYDDFIARWYALSLTAIEPAEVLLTFEAAPDQGVALPDLLAAFENTLQTIADEGVPAATFDRIMKKQLSALEAIQHKRRPAIRLVISQTANDAAPIGPKTEISRYGQTTLDDVNDLIRALAGSGSVAAALVSSASSD
ncbi:MAG: insulinase family protein, partial [Pseudomonadota bacterium]